MSHSHSCIPSHRIGDLDPSGLVIYQLISSDSYEVLDNQHAIYPLQLFAISFVNILSSSITHIRHDPIMCIESSISIDSSSLG